VVPDGEQLAYVRMDVDTEDRDIWVMEADGSDHRRLTTLGSAYDPAWSPEGTASHFPPTRRATISRNPTSPQSRSATATSVS
jgi:Tol biopolymer transport system component